MRIACTFLAAIAHVGIAMRLSAGPRPTLHAHGAHAVLDFDGFACDPAEGGEWMLNSLSSTVAAHGVQVVHKKLVALPMAPGASPPGFTAVCLLDESHATAHCYSDRGWLAIDVFTCGAHDPRPIADDLRNQIEARWGARCVQFEVHSRFLHESLDASSAALVSGDHAAAPAEPPRLHEALATDDSMVRRRSCRAPAPQLKARGRGADDDNNDDGAPGGWLQDAWARYVLLRPGMNPDEFKNSTRLRTARSWSWAERTPGTARTIYFSIAIITLFALPVLLTNPLVLSWLLETAALSREGVTPQEYTPWELWADFVSEVFERPAY